MSPGWFLSVDGGPRDDTYDLTDVVSPVIAKSTLDRLCRWLIKLVGANFGLLSRIDEHGVLHIEEEYRL